MNEKKINVQARRGATACGVPLALVADLVKTARRPLRAIALSQAILRVARHGRVRPRSDVTAHRSAAVAQFVSIVLPALSGTRCRSNVFISNCVSQPGHTGIDVRFEGPLVSVFALGGDELDAWFASDAVLLTCGDAGGSHSHLRFA